MITVCMTCEGTGRERARLPGNEALRIPASVTGVTRTCIACGGSGVIGVKPEEIPEPPPSGPRLTLEETRELMDRTRSANAKQNENAKQKMLAETRRRALQNLQLSALPLPAALPVAATIPAGPDDTAPQAALIVDPEWGFSS